MTARLVVASTLLMLGTVALGAPAWSSMPSRDALAIERAIVPAQAGGTATVRTSYANLRAEPSTRSPRLGQVKQGARLQVLGTSGDWVQVKSGDKTGY
ncbi:MAG: SH3 domain-containing protein, partial [Proteobacteria bacterium]|nr:SH3 domain-containing protein [Pseudomonadota bacterium]